MSPARYRLLAVATLLLAAFNLTFRLGHEFVTEWDESLYAVSAWETFRNGSWIGTTFFGQLDYYNTKPPLMMWLIATSFKLFGPSLWSLRIVSAVSAWLTIAVLQVWTKRVFGALVAIATTLVLATMFGFIHVHSGRDAVTDAPFTLVVALTAIVCFDAADRPRRLVWLGPLLAVAFMLRGMAVLMPAAIVALIFAVDSRKRVWDLRWLSAAAVLFVAPVGAWILARYRFDGWNFLGPLFFYDFVSRSVDVIEDHPGGPFFYLNILQKNHYDWLVAAVGALILCPPPWREALKRAATTRTGIVIAAWAIVTLMMPTLMRTKLPWYLNTFYPVFAVLVAVLVTRPLALMPAPDARRWSFVALLVIVFGVAEGKLIWYSYQNRDVSRSEQALLLLERDQLRGQRVFDEVGNRAAHFVAEGIVGAEAIPAGRMQFLEQADTGDFMLTERPLDAPEVELVRESGPYLLYRRR